MVKCNTLKDKPNGYHFLECGLDYVYLVNGYETEVDESGEEYVTIHNADDLHRQIARTILLHNPLLGAQEIRFFRSILGMTQKQLASYMGVTAREIQRWESFKNPQKMHVSTDGMLRILVWDEFLESKDPAKLIRNIRAEREHYQMLKMMERDNSWRLAA